MISKKLADEFINTLEPFSNYTISIYNDRGQLMCSTKKGNNTHFNIQSFLISSSLSSNIEKEGVNTVLVKILENSRIAGCMEVSGKDDNINPIALALKMSIEIRLKYEKIQIEDKKILSTNQKIIKALLSNNIDYQEIHNLFKQANRTIDIPRRMIILLPDDSEFINLVLNFDMYYDSKEDIIAVNENNIIILKDMSKANDNANEYSKRYIYHLIEATSFKGKFLIGYTSSHCSEIKVSYSCLNWLKEYITANYINETILFFSNYIDYYFISQIPFEILDNIFHQFVSNDLENNNDFLELTDTLIKNNYNVTQSSNDLFIHKNTLLYRLEKIKKEFDLDPIHSEADRSFIKFLNYYLKYHIKIKGGK